MEEIIKVALITMGIGLSFIAIGLWFIRDKIFKKHNRIKNRCNKCKEIK